MKSYKVVVTGTFNAGKTRFVETASDIEIVKTERRITMADLARVKDQTTVALDYGQTRVGGVMFHLYGTPGQARFEFMWEILSHDTAGFILLVDSQDRGSFMEALRMIRLLRKRTRVPYLVAANKQDGRSALSPDEIRRRLKLPTTVPVVPCIAYDEESVRTVLKHMVPLLH